MKKTAAALTLAVLLTVTFFVSCNNPLGPDNTDDPPNPQATQSFTVIFNKNADDAAGTMPSQTIVQGRTARLNSNAYSRPGHAFAGWAGTSAGSVQYADEANFTMGSSDVELFACWAVLRKISFNKNHADASGIMEDQYIGEGLEDRLLPNNFVRSGYRFMGWALTGGGTVEYYNEELITMGSSDLVLFAVWDVAVPFIMTIRTTEANQTFEVPAIGSYSIDWGDGTVQTGLNGASSHIYAVPGDYDVSIDADFLSINQTYTGGTSYLIIDVKQWGNTVWTSMTNMFCKAENLTGISAADKPNLSNVENMDYMFYFATQFNADVSDWDVSNVRSLGFMFCHARSFNCDLSNWDVSNAVNIKHMFEHAYEFESDLSGWNTGKVESMTSLFNEARVFKSDLSGWDTRNVKYMGHMFFGAESFESDLSGWDVGNVEEMLCMFQNAKLFNSDLSSWDVSNVELIILMFAGAESFNSDLTPWDVRKANDLTGMFDGATSFNGDLSGWDVSNTEFMGGMFRNAVSFNRDISGWNVSRFSEEPENFSEGAVSWDEDYKPRWGQP